MTATIRGVPTIFGVLRTVETQDVDNFVETVENCGRTGTGSERCTQSISLRAAAGLSACSALLTGHGSHHWDLQEITKNSTKNIAKS
jgi:hypothetical protein